MGRYLDLAKKVVTAPNGPLEPERYNEINELNEKSPDAADLQGSPRLTGMVRHTKPNTRDPENPSVCKTACSFTRSCTDINVVVATSVSTKATHV